MKKVLLAIGCLISLLSRAQTIQYLGSTTTQIYVRGQLRIDTVVYLPLRDTTFTPTQVGAMVVKSSNGGLYLWSGTKWNTVPVGSTAWGTLIGSISSQTDLITLLNGYQPLLTPGYGIKIASNTISFDTANARKVDTVFRLNDSTLTYKINGHSYNVLIRGTAAGGINSLVLNVPAFLYANPITFSNTGGAWSGSAVLNSQLANTFLAGPTTGSAAQPTMRTQVLADLPTGIPNGNLANSSIGLSLGTAGSTPGWGAASVALGGTALLNVPIASASTSGFLSSTDWTNFNNATSPLVTSVNGQLGAVTTLTADSIKKLPIDTSSRRNGYALTFDSVNHKWVLAPGSTTSGTVTSVALTVPAIFSVSGSPITSSGTLAIGSVNQSANTVYAGPSSGASSAAGFRSLVNADFPTSGVSAGTYNSLTVNAQGIVTAATIVGAGITSLNGLTGTTQVFATGTSGSDFNISSVGTTHTFNIPDASASNRGVLTSTDWNTFNAKQPGGSYMTNPMTTNGDMIYQTGGTYGRLAAAAHAGMKLTSGASGAISWADTTASGSGPQNLQQTMVLGPTTNIDLIDTNDIKGDSAIYNDGDFRGSVTIGDTIKAAPLRKIRIYGTSLDLTPGLGTTLGWGQYLTFHRQWLVEDSAVSGQGISSLAPISLQTQVPNMRAYALDSVAFLALGTFGINDAIGDSNNVKIGAQNWVNKAIAEGYPLSKILIISVPYSPARLATAPYLGISQRFAAANGVQFLDLYTPSMNAYFSGQAIYQSDSLHFTYIGQKLYGQLVNGVMKEGPRFGDLLVNRSDTIALNHLVRGTSTTNGITFPNGGFEQKAKDSSINFMAQPSLSNGDYLGLVLAPNPAQTALTDSMEMRMTVNTGAASQFTIGRRAAGALTPLFYANGSNNLGLGTTTLQSGYPLTTSGAVYVGGKQFVNGSIKIQGDNTYDAQRIAFFRQSNSVIAMGIASSNDLQIGNAFGNVDIGQISPGDGTTFQNIRFRVQTNGRILVNTTTDNTVDNLQVNGTIGATALNIVGDAIYRPMYLPLYSGSGNHIGIGLVSTNEMQISNAFGPISFGGTSGSTFTEHSQFNTGATRLSINTTDDASNALNVNGRGKFTDTLKLPNIVRKLLDSTNFKPMVVDVSGNIFKTDWATFGSGGATSVGTPSGSSTANGADITSSVLTLHPADGTNPGIVTTAAQTIAGAKTFSGNLISQHALGFGSAPTTGTLGTNVTSLTVSGTDKFMQLTLVTSGAVAGTLGIVTYNAAWSASPITVISPADANTATAIVGTTGGYVIINGTATTTATLAGAILLAGTYVFNVYSGSN